MSPSGNQNMDDLISQLGGDARSAQLAQLLMTMNKEGGDAEKTLRAEHKATLRKAKELLSDMRRENLRLREVNAGLLAHSELLAGAVGACPECWGEDQDCALCEGDGAPGAFLPEQESFEEFVRPVLTMLRASMVEKRNQQKRTKMKSDNALKDDNKEYENEPNAA